MKKFTPLTWITLLTGLYYTFIGLALLFAPAWFFGHIGPFPPFNRHYMGDLGTFILPIGIGLLLAAKNPAGHPLFLGMVAAANLGHALNHLYDDRAEPLSHWLSDTLPLLLFSLLFLHFLWQARKEIYPKL